VRTISSNSRFGRSRVTLEFAEDADIDVAAADTRDAVARIANALPDDAEDPRIVKADADAQPVLRIAVTSATPQRAGPHAYLVDEQVADRLISIEGVADLQIYGDREPIFRVDIDMMELASRGLTLADLRRTLSDAAYDAPAGDLSGDRQSINVRTTATVATPGRFRGSRDPRQCPRPRRGPRHPWPGAERDGAARQRPDRASGSASCGRRRRTRSRSRTACARRRRPAGGPARRRQHLRHLRRRRLHPRLDRGGAEDAGAGRGHRRGGDLPLPARCAPR
jgi:hypothetical protein